MGRKASGNVRTDRVVVKQKNGDRYVYERKSKYDPVKKYYVTFHCVLLGKMKPESQDRYDLLPTRPKAKPEKTQSQATAAFRNATGMIDIVRHMEKLSGVGKKITDAIPDAPGLSAKTRTLVWYAFATDGDTWPGIKAWSLRYNGLLPYSDTCFSNDMYHDVFVALGRKEEIRQAIFKMRAQGLGDEELIALDSTTIETFSQRGGKNRKSLHKDRLVKKVYKIVYFYSIDQRRPIAYAIIPGNIPDSMTVPNALKQLESLSLKKADLVYDNGYCTDGTLYTL